MPELLASLELHLDCWQGQWQYTLLGRYKPDQIIQSDLATGASDDKATLIQEALEATKAYAEVLRRG